MQIVTAVVTLAWQPGGVNAAEVAPSAGARGPREELGQIHGRLLDLDPGLTHRSAQGIVEDRNLGAGQLHPAADQQQDHEEEQKQLHRRKRSPRKQALGPGSAPP